MKAHACSRAFAPALAAPLLFCLGVTLIACPCSADVGRPLAESDPNAPRPSVVYYLGSGGSSITQPSRWSQADLSQRVALRAGCLFGASMASSSGGHLGVFYQRKGAQEHFSGWVGGFQPEPRFVRSETNLTLHYLDVPLSVHHALPRALQLGGLRPYVMGGADAAFLVRAVSDVSTRVQEYSYRSSEQIQVNLNRFDIGLHLSLGASRAFGKHLGIAELGYSMGFRSIGGESRVRDAGGRDYGEAKNRLLTLSLGFER